MGGGGMIAEFSGVPKPVLQAVFGRVLGRQIWQQNRGRGPLGSEPTTAGAVADAEIVAGMIEYLGSRAGETLGQRGLQAKAIGLRIVYADGVSGIERMRLARPTNEGPELAAAAISLSGRWQDRGVAVELLDLTVTSVQTECVTQRADGLQHAMASALGVQA